LLKSPRGRATNPQNLIGQSLKAKKLLGDQILKFGLNFLETGELWSTYFGTVEKPFKRTTRHPKFVSQSSKTKKLWGSNFEKDFNFLEIGELWSTYFDVVGMP